jgi:hypothetical protein
VLSASALTLTHANALANRLEQLVMQQGDLQVTSVSVSKSEVQQAHALGTSAGKLYLIERLQQATGTDEAFDPKDWLNTPVREIIRETATRSGAPQPNGEQNGQTPAGSQSDATPPQSGTGATVPGGSTTSPQPTGGEQGGPVGPGPTDSSGGTGGAGGEPPAGGSPPG